MIEVLSHDVLIFVSGLLFGVFINNRWNQPRKSISNTEGKNEDNFEFECDTASPTDLGNNKLVLIVRNDLKMGKGKVAAQCSHAAVLAHESSRKKCPEIFKNWKNKGQPKIVVKIDGEEEMMNLAVMARNCQLVVSIVQDAGRTQVASGTRTVLAIGPGPKEKIDQLTGHLKLY